MEKGDDPIQYIKYIRNIVSNNIYGGKIDNKFDLKILDSLVHKFMDERFFTQPRLISLVDDILEGFEANNYQEYINWALKVDIIESPIWAGLPVTAEDVLNNKNLQ